MFNFIKNLFNWDKYSDELLNAINNDALLIDVRTQDEFNTGSATGAVNIPLYNIMKDLNLIPINRPIIVFCQSGMRSRIAVSMLKNKGIGNILNGGTMKSIIKLQQTLLK
jgi:phage shock protein E